MRISVPSGRQVRHRPSGCRSTRKPWWTLVWWRSQSSAELSRLVAPSSATHSRTWWTLSLPRFRGHRHSGRAATGEVSSWAGCSRRSSRTRSSRCISETGGRSPRSPKEFGLSATSVANWVRAAETRPRSGSARRRPVSPIRTDRPAGTGAGEEGRRARDPGKSAGLLRSTVGAVELYRYIQARKATIPSSNQRHLPGAGCLDLGLLRLGAPADSEPPAAAPPPTCDCSTQIRLHPRPSSATTAPRGSIGRCCAQGHHVGRHRVARLMRLHGIRARRARSSRDREVRTAARRPEVPDLVRRDFHADVADRSGSPT